MPNIATIIRNAIARDESQTDAAILGLVRAEHPDARTSPACVAYYRSEARRIARGGGTFSAARTETFAEAALRGAMGRPRSRAFRTTPETAFDATALSDRAFGLEFEFMRNGLDFEEYSRIVGRVLAGFPGHSLGERVGEYYHSSGRTWDIKSDGSCDAELATPRLTRADWPVVVAVLKALRDAGATVNNSCGVHVHHETRGMRLPQLRSLIRLWGAFDEPLHNALPASRRANTYAVRTDAVTAARIAAADARGVRYDVTRRGRYASLNLTNWWRHGRIEVRSHHGTLDADKAGWWLQMTQAIVDRAGRGRLNAFLGVTDTTQAFAAWTPRQRFAAVRRVIGTAAHAVLAAWTRERNPEYFTTLQTAEAA